MPDHTPSELVEKVALAHCKGSAGRSHAEPCPDPCEPCLAGSRLAIKATLEELAAEGRKGEGESVTPCMCFACIEDFARSHGIELDGGES